MYCQTFSAIASSIASAASIVPILVVCMLLQVTVLFFASLLLFYYYGNPTDAGFLTIVVPFFSYKSNVLAA
jgi:hypothetical protein